MKIFSAFVLAALSLTANAHDIVYVCFDTGKIITCFQAGTSLEEATIATVKEFNKMNREYKLSVDRYSHKVTVTLPPPVENAISVDVERTRQLQYSY